MDKKTVFIKRLFCFFMKGMSMAKPAVFLELQFPRTLFLVLCRAVVPTLALAAGKHYYVSHMVYVSNCALLFAIQ
jgi:hypothetical protein